MLAAYNAADITRSGWNAQKTIAGLDPQDVRPDMAALDTEMIEHGAGVLGVLLEGVLRRRIRRRRTLADPADIHAHEPEAIGKPFDEMIPSPHRATTRGPQQQRGIAFVAIDLDMQPCTVDLYLHCSPPSVDLRRHDTGLNRGLGGVAQRVGHAMDHQSALPARTGENRSLIEMTPLLLDLGVSGIETDDGGSDSRHVDLDGTKPVVDRLDVGAQVATDLPDVATQVVS